MVGETPNIDRIGNEGAIFMTYYAEQSCTARSLDSHQSIAGRATHFRRARYCERRQIAMRD